MAFTTLAGIPHWFFLSNTPFVHHGHWPEAAKHHIKVSSIYLISVAENLNAEEHVYLPTFPMGSGKESQGQYLEYRCQGKQS